MFIRKTAKKSYGMEVSIIQESPILRQLERSLAAPFFKRNTDDLSYFAIDRRRQHVIHIQNQIVVPVLVGLELAEDISHKLH
jgi:hypothetical protein